jgi:hypothetical protein
MGRTSRMGLHRRFGRAHVHMRSRAAVPLRKRTRARRSALLHAQLHARTRYVAWCLGAHREGLYGSCRMVAGGCGCKA